MAPSSSFQLPATTSFHAAPTTTVLAGPARPPTTVLQTPPMPKAMPKATTTTVTRSAPSPKLLSNGGIHTAQSPIKTTTAVPGLIM
jgi:hypothetical protein